MYLPSEITKAILYVYTMQGVQIEQFEIYERGATFTTIEGHTLNAGMLRHIKTINLKVHVA